MPRKQQPTGGSAMAKRQGLKPIMVMLTETEHRLVRMAAAASGEPMSHFVRATALVAAEKILEKISNGV